MVKVIVIAGTPGVGKSTLAGLLAKKLNGLHLDLSKLVVSKKLYAYYDENRQSYVIDEYRVVEEVNNIVNSGEYKIIIIDTHYPEILPRDIVDKIIVLRLNPLILEKRLRDKGWFWNKIKENVLAEILSVVTVNVIEKFGQDKVYEIDATDKNTKELADIVFRIINDSNDYKPGAHIDWLSLLPLEVITRYE